jgi:hypothetical protein
MTQAPPLTAVAELVREQAARGVPFRFHVTSGSMAPLIRAGDEVLVRAAPAGLRRGDVVLVEAGGAFVVHRLRAILPDGRLVTHGDRNLTPDTPWAPQALVGQVVAVVRGGREHDLTAGRAGWLRRLAQWEQGFYDAARAAKRALFGTRPLGFSVAVTRGLRAGFAGLARWVGKDPGAGRRTPGAGA